VVKEQKELLEKTLSDTGLSQQHLLSVLRKLQAGHSALMITEDDGITEQTVQFEDDGDDDDLDDDTPDELQQTQLPATSTISQEALHIIQALETSGFEGSLQDESDAIHSLIDQLPLENFMTELGTVDDAVLNTRVGSKQFSSVVFSQIVAGVLEPMIKSHWDTCAPPWGSVRVPNRSLKHKLISCIYCLLTMQWSALQALCQFACFTSFGLALSISTTFAARSLATAQSLR
jgi:hypothetical protein